MPGPPYRGLRIILGILSLLSAVGGIAISSGRPIAMRFFSGRPKSGQHYHALLRASLRELMLLSGLRSSAHEVRHFFGQR